MEQNDDIAYKAWVENLQEPAPEGAWNAIADQLDIDAAWDGISESLDIDDVWHNIETELPQAVTVSNPAAPTHLPKLFWLAAALVLLTLTTPLTEDRTGQDQQSTIQNTTQAQSGQSTGKSEETTNLNIADKAETNQPGNKIETIVQSVEKKDKTENTNTVANAKDVDDTQPPIESNHERLVISKMPAQAALQPILVGDTIAKKQEVLVSDRITEKPVIQASKSQTDTLIAENKVETDSVVKIAEIEPKKDSVQQRLPERATWYVGVIGSIKNTWLINPETANGLKSESLNDTQVTFGKEFGVTVQRSLGGMSDLQFEYYFYSEIGQRYHEYINALYQTKDIRLRYQKFQVLYRTRIFRKINAPALYATGGIRVSRLTLADTSIGNESQEVTQEYRPWDYGFILGTEAEFKLSNKLMLVSGLRGSYGLRNIYLGTSQAPAEFNKTHTASVGLILGLKYRIH